MYSKEITTAEDYLDMIGNLVYLLDETIRPIERIVDGGEMDIDFLLNRIPAIVSMVNTLGYLAGRESMFSDIRPKGVLEYQAKIIATSKSFDDRLARILQFVRQKGLKERADAIIRSYYFL